MALDNNGGRRDGPPDLDEIIRQFKNTITRFFGGSPGPSTGSSTNLVVLLVVGVIGLWLASGFYVVDERERAVVLRFGAFSKISEPGLHWHLPYPFETREVVKLTEVRNVDIGTQPAEAQMLTGDENIVDVQFSVQYSVGDPKAFLFNNRFDNADATELVQQASETAMRAIVGRRPIDFVRNQGRDEIAAEAKQSIQHLLDRYKTGIHIDRVNLRSIQVPDEVQQAFDDVLKAEQDRERLKSEGEAYANDLVPRARGLAERLKKEAEAYRQSLVSRAQGDAKRFEQIVTEYQKAPQVTRDRLYLEAMQQILSTTTKAVVDQKSGQVLYLPLDKMLPNSQSGATSPSAAPNAAAPAQDVEAPAQADAARNRNREPR